MARLDANALSWHPDHRFTNAATRSRVVGIGLEERGGLDRLREGRRRGAVDEALGHPQAQRWV